MATLCFKRPAQLSNYILFIHLKYLGTEIIHEAIYLKIRIIINDLLAWYCENEKCQVSLRIPLAYRQKKKTPLYFPTAPKA